MDHVRIGVSLRALRMRRGLRQLDVARKATISPATISRLERGRADSISLRSLERVAAVLEARLDVTLRWRGGELDRILNAAHAALGEAVVRWILSQPGWQVTAEVSFAFYGERGVFDLLAWHAATRRLVVIELKTAIVDVPGLLGTLDRKRRLAPRVARERGWQPTSVTAWLIVTATRTNRRRIAAHRALLASQLPADGRALRASFQRPDSAASGVAMWPDPLPPKTRPGCGTRRPADPRTATPSRPDSGSESRSGHTRRRPAVG